MRWIDVLHEANRLLEHRFAQFAREAREPLAIHGVVFLEAANVEPVAGELGREVPDAAVLQHPPGLRAEHVGFAQIPGRRVLHQLLVRHARPEEVAQAAGDFIVRQRPHVSGRCRAIGQRIDAVAEVRRHQDARHGVANRVFVTETLIAQRTVEREQVVRLRLRQRPAVRLRRERQQRVEVARLGRGPRLLQRAHVRVHLVEIVADHSERDVIGDLSRLGQIHVGQLRHLRFGRDVVVFRAEHVELRAGHEAGRLGTLEPDELLELPDRRERDEIQLFPEVVQLTLLRRVEDQLVQRAVVAEIAHLAVEAGAQQTMALGVGRDLARVGRGTSGRAPRRKTDPGTGRRSG